MEHDAKSEQAPPLEGLWSTDRAVQNEAFQHVMARTEARVEWSYRVWDELLDNLDHPDNHNRAIAAQVLCNLAKSDPEQRVLRDLPALIEATRDERFVTARHCLQSLWKIGALGGRHQASLVKALRSRFEEAASEKNWSLIRYDIIVSLRKIHDATQAESVRTAALELIESESDPKYRQKYAREWKT